VQLVASQASRSQRAAWLAALACCLVPDVAPNEEVRPQFQVSARVVAAVTLEPVDVPPVIVITAEDLRLGHMDVTLRFSIRTNDPRGTVLRFTPLGGVAKSMLIRGLSTSLMLNDQRWRSGNGCPLTSRWNPARAKRCCGARHLSHAVASVGSTVVQLSSRCAPATTGSRLPAAGRRLAWPRSSSISSARTLNRLPTAKRPRAML
jgi:hypothetical protein